MDDQQFIDELLDIEELVSQGLPDADIAERLDSDVATIEYVRQRLEELRTI